MLTKVQKYIKIADVPKNAAIRAKLSGAKNMEEALEILKNAGFYIGAQTVKAMKADKADSKEDAKVVEKAQTEQVEKIVKAVEESEAVKAANEEAGKKAKEAGKA